MEAKHFYNGAFLEKSEIHISPDDVGFLRGHAVFDFFRVSGKTPIFIEDHFERLWESAESFNIKIPYAQSELKSIVQQLIEVNQFENSTIKIIVTGGLTNDGFTPSSPNVLVLNQVFQAPDSEVYITGASLMLYDYHRDAPEVKSTIYAKALNLQEAWKSEGHIDVLYHEGNLVSEVSRSSVFFFKNGKLKTNQQGVLKGVTQRNLKKAVEGIYELEVGDIVLSELLEADEVFITSTTKRILPIVKIGEQYIGNGQVGEHTKEVMAIFNDYVEDYIAQRKV